MQREGEWWLPGRSNLVGGDAPGQQAPGHGAPVHVLVDQVLQLLPADGRLLQQHQLREHPQEEVDGVDGPLQTLLGAIT